MTWSELFSEWGELSSECGASCLGASFLWSELSKGELSLGRVVLFPGLRPLQSTRPFSCIAVAAIFTCKSFFLLNVTYLARFINI